MSEDSGAMVGSTFYIIHANGEIVPWTVVNETRLVWTLETQAHRVPLRIAKSDFPGNFLTREQMEARRGDRTKPE